MKAAARGPEAAPRQVWARKASPPAPPPVRAAGTGVGRPASICRSKTGGSPSSAALCSGRHGGGAAGVHGGQAAAAAVALGFGLTVSRQTVSRSRGCQRDGTAQALGEEGLSPDRQGQEALRGGGQPSGGRAGRTPVRMHRKPNLRDIRNDHTRVVCSKGLRDSPLKMPPPTYKSVPPHNHGARGCIPPPMLLSGSEASSPGVWSRRGAPDKCLSGDLLFKRESLCRSLLIPSRAVTSVLWAMSVPQPIYSARALPPI